VVSEIKVGKKKEEEDVGGTMYLEELDSEKALD